MQNNSTPRDFILDFIGNKSGKSRSQMEELINADYLMMGLMDSFGAIEMIESIEQKFTIEISMDDLENPSFRVVSGVIDIVSSHLK